MSRFKTTTICAASILTVGFAMMFHEAAHVLAGKWAGGMPTLITSTEVKGNFDNLSPAGFVALGSAGFIINILFFALGLWGLNRKHASSELRLGAWFFFVVNGMIVTTAMLSESLVGFGDWMTILNPYTNTTFLRVVVVSIGTLGLIFMVRRSGALLAKIIPPGEPTQRIAEARRIILIGAVAATVLVLGASIVNPIGTTRSVLLALGAGLVPFIPAFFGTRFVSRYSSENMELYEHGGWLLYLAAGLTTVVIWFIVGPGIKL
jgi:hypothetical protein